MTSPTGTILKISGNVLLARCLGLIAELGVADMIAAQPQTPAQLAAACDMNADALARMLRYLIANGFFRSDDNGLVHNTELSAALRNVPGSVHGMIRQLWQDVVWDVYRHLPHTLKTGQPAFNAAFGTDFFSYLGAHPEIGDLFDSYMAQASAPENAVLAAAFPFTGTVVDVGGGRGGLMAAILAAHPTVRGVLYEQPHVLADANRLFVRAHGQRCTLRAGDFFTAVPTGGDVYVLKRILHDWPDDKALAILNACRAAMGPSSRLLVIDAVIAPGDAPDPNKALDVGIMALLEGRERTEEDFRRLLTTAGLGLVRVIPPSPPSTLSIVEAQVVTGEIER
jgi:hypothetical protein